MLALGQSEFVVVWRPDALPAPNLLGHVREQRSMVEGAASVEAVGDGSPWVVRRGTADLDDVPGWLAFNGAAIDRRPGTTGLHSAARRATTTEGLRDDLWVVSGNFAFVAELASGDVVAGTDPLGAAPLLAYESDDLWCVGNSAWLLEDVVRAFGRRLTRSPVLFGIESLARTGAFGRTAFEQVRRLGPAEMATLPRGGAPRIDAPRDFLDRYRPTRSFDDHLDGAAEQLMGSVADLHRHAAIAGTRPVSDLTGGFDSRIVLAAIVAAGLHKDFDFFCGGSHGGPEYRTFYYLREALGLDEGAPPPAGEVILIADGPVAAFGDFLFRSMGLTSDVLPLPAVPRPFAHKDVHLRGGFGTHKAYNVLPRGIDGPEEAAQALLGRLPWRRNRDRVRPEVAELVGTGVEALFRSRLAAGSTPDEVAHQWHIEGRARDHFGAVWSSQLRSRLTFHVLYSTDAMAASYATDSTSRAQGRVTYELMRRLCEPLTTFPFTQDAWATELVRGIPRLGVAAQQRPITARSPHIGQLRLSADDSVFRSASKLPIAGGDGAGTWRARQARRSRPSWVIAFDATLDATREVTHDLASHSLLWDVFDRERTLALVDRGLDGEWQLPDMLHCHHVLAGALWMDEAERGTWLG